jgi:hypothetical protein
LELVFSVRYIDLRSGHYHIRVTTCEERFQGLKQKLTSAHLLILPNLNESFVVYYDASKKGLGGVLMQKDRWWLIL